MMNMFEIIARHVFAFDNIDLVHRLPYTSLLSDIISKDSSYFSHSVCGKCGLMDNGKFQRSILA